MMLERSVIDAYTNRLNGLSAATKRAIARSLAGIEFDSVAQLRERIIEVLEPILGATTDMAATYAAEFYDEVRELSVGKPLGATVDANRNPEATAGFVKAYVERVANKGLLESLDLFGDRADYEIKRAAGECVFVNGKLDPLKPRFARVPSGAETCPFCIMLASRGFVYSSESAAGDHYHANCDCRIVPGFSDTEVEGYDTDALYRQFRDDVESGRFKPKQSEHRKERRRTS